MAGFGKVSDPSQPAHAIDNEFFRWLARSNLLSAAHMASGSVCKIGIPDVGQMMNKCALPATEDLLP